MPAEIINARSERILKEGMRKSTIPQEQGCERHASPKPCRLPDYAERLYPGEHNEDHIVRDYRDTRHGRYYGQEVHQLVRSLPASTLAVLTAAAGTDAIISAHARIHPDDDSHYKLLISNT